MTVLCSVPKGELSGYRTGCHEFDGVRSFTKCAVAPFGVEWLEREVGFLVRLRDCANVVSVLATPPNVFGSVDVVLEWLLPIPQNMEAVRVAFGVLSALEQCHGRGIVHGDIKPEHLRMDEKGVVKLLDFNLAQVSP